MGEWGERLAELRAARRIADKTDETPAASRWGWLLEHAGDADPELARRLGLFRDCGCALTIAGGQVGFGPFDDFADCDWTDAEDWRHDYGHYLASQEEALRGLLAGLLGALAPASPGPIDDQAARVLALFASEPRLTVDDTAGALRVSKRGALAAVHDQAEAGAIERCPGSVAGTGLWRLATSEAASA